MLVGVKVLEVRQDNAYGIRGGLAGGEIAIGDEDNLGQDKFVTGMEIFFEGLSCGGGARRFLSGVFPPVSGVSPPESAPGAC